MMQERSCGWYAWEILININNIIIGVCVQQAAAAHFQGWIHDILLTGHDTSVAFVSVSVSWPNYFKWL